MTSRFINGQTIDETDYIQASIGASDAGKAVVTRDSDGLIDGSFLAFGYGGGSDGAIDLDGTNTYSFLSKSGSVYTMTRNIYCTNITIRTGATLKTDGFLYFFTGTLNGAGTAKITWGSPSNGSNASGNSGGAGASSAGTGMIKNTAGGNGGQGGYPGVTGQGQGGVAGASQTASPGASGRTGGNGDGGIPGSGGAGGTASTRFPVAVIAFLTMVGCDITSTGALISYMGSAGSGGGGGGGRVDGSNSFGGGGGAGSSGGGCIGFGNIVSGTLTIENIGGNGGNGATLNGQTGGGGAGGAGGWSILIYRSKSATITYTLTGGAGGTGANTPATAPTGVYYEANIADLTR